MSRYTSPHTATCAVELTTNLLTASSEGRRTTITGAAAQYLAW